MDTFNLRDYLFKDQPGEELGQRAEVIITLLLGFLSTSVAFFVYQNTAIIFLSIVTNLVALFTLIQALRRKYTYLVLFPAITAVSICLVSIIEGQGVHDMTWIGLLGLFLLVNIYSRKNDRLVIVLGIFMVLLYVGTGLAEINNLIPNPLGTDLDYLTLNSFFIAITMAAILVVFRRNRLLLKLAAENKNEQISANQRLEEINRTLEDQVQIRTKELNELNEQLQAKAARLQAASDISHDLMVHLNEKPAELLTRMARVVSEKLGYYHVGIFLLDEAREFAVLRASNSKGGQQMLARRHQLKVGGVGIVSYVSQSGRARIALDTGADAVFFNNPYLPETRSEIALPLKIGNVTIGVLDVQSTQSSAFNDEDINTLMTITNQIAILMKSIFSEETKSSGLVQYRSQFNADTPEGFSYRPDGSIVSNILLEGNALTQRAIASGETVVVNQPSRGDAPTLAVPVKFREQVVGVIHIESTENARAWTDDEISLVQAISDRAALALENARLFADATRRAEQEETISRVTTQIGSSTDFDRILQTTIQELGLALGASRSFIQLGTDFVQEEKASE
ncbi:MAG: GAF domain-containing protein [Anaerolineales bacterium]|nr:GAF domain-containing protein [Anaerolineales bacterium]